MAKVPRTKAKDPTPNEPEAALVVQRVGRETLLVPIRGTAPLVTNRFPEKAKRQMLDAMRGQKKLKVAKDPQAEYEAAFYRLKDGAPAFPALGFKQATVGAARFYGKDISMKGLTLFCFFSGEIGEDGHQYIRINGSDPEMREDVVKVGISGHDLRYRPQFSEWTATLEVTYITGVLSRDSMISLIEAGGMVGVGEWRPERKGDFGTYEIDPSREVEVVKR